MVPDSALNLAAARDGAKNRATPEQRISDKIMKYWGNPKYFQF